MKGRIDKGDLRPKNLKELPGEIAAHVFTLGELEKVVHRIMTTMLALELEIRFSISELKTAGQNVSVTDKRRPNAPLPAREVARKRRQKAAPVI